MKTRKILAFFLAFAMTLAGLNVGGIAETKKADAATFTNLNQSEIVSAMGAGWNLGNQLEAALNGTPSETAWGNPTITSSLIKAVKKAGFSSIRVPVSYLNKIAAQYALGSLGLNFFTDS